MSKMSTEPLLHTLNGPTMGTRWSAVFYASSVINIEPIRQALTASVTEVDSQMSSWQQNSDLMRLNRANPGDWVTVPEPLMEVLDCALDIGRRSAGAFDIGVGDAVNAWGFGVEEANQKKIAAALACVRVPVCERLELDSQAGRVRKMDPVTLDLSGIAKGYAVDRMMSVLSHYGITDALVSLDGELAAKGQQPDGSLWTIALECPEYNIRAPLSILELHNAAIATSGDYRHWVDVGDRRLSHTMEPQRGGPLVGSPASVTVVAASCMQADAWATALMVMGCQDGADTARRVGLNALFISRVGNEFVQSGVGQLFEPMAVVATSRA